MSSQMTLEQVEQQIVQFPPNEQLKLIARIAEQLSVRSPGVPKAATEAESLQQQREKNADGLLALCDSAAEMWEGAFDAVGDIRQ